MSAELPIALFHGYGDFPRKRAGKPDINASLQVLAASELLKTNKISKAVILVRSVHKGKPPIALTMAAQLRRNLPHLAEDRLVVLPVADTTRQEYKYFKRLAADNGWTDLMAVGKASHLERIERAAKRKLKREIPIVSHAELLRGVGTRYLGIMDQWSNSEEEAAFGRREKWINRIDSLPLIGGICIDFLQSVLRNKQLEINLLQWLKK